MDPWKGSHRPLLTSPSPTLCRPKGPGLIRLEIAILGNKAPRNDLALTRLEIAILGNKAPRSAPARARVILVEAPAPARARATLVEAPAPARARATLVEARMISIEARVRTRTRPSSEARFQAIRRNEVRGRQGIPSSLEGPPDLGLDPDPVTVLTARVSLSGLAGKPPRTIEVGGPEAKGSTATSSPTILMLMPSNSSN
jgi:hypothetical protein